MWMLRVVLALGAARALRPPAALSHSSACCVTPPDDGAAWRAVQAARLALRDAGLYRWPPHANLVYPFAAAPRSAAGAVRRACRRAAPFRVRLAETGVFGGARRGVLWLRPDVVSPGRADALAALQAAICREVALETPASRARSQPFVPHVTLAHFESAAAARAAGAALDWEPVEFDVDAVALVVRDGPDGQFAVADRVPLGFAPLWRLRRVARRRAPTRFRGMPAEPYPWTAAAMAARKRGRFAAKRRRRRRRSPAERAAVAARTPDEIAAIRAARAAKKRRADGAAGDDATT